MKGRRKITFQYFRGKGKKWIILRGNILLGDGDTLDKSQEMEKSFFAFKASTLTNSEDRGNRGKDERETWFI